MMNLDIVAEKYRIRWLGGVLKLPDGKSPHDPEYQPNDDESNGFEDSSSMRSLKQKRKQYDDNSGKQDELAGAQDGRLAGQLIPRCVHCIWPASFILALFCSWECLSWALHAPEYLQLHRPSGALEKGEINQARACRFAVDAAGVLPPPPLPPLTHTTIRFC